MTLLSGWTLARGEAVEVVGGWGLMCTESLGGFADSPSLSDSLWGLHDPHVATWNLCPEISLHPGFPSSMKEHVYI